MRIKKVKKNLKDESIERKSKEKTKLVWKPNGKFCAATYPTQQY